MLFRPDRRSRLCDLQHQLRRSQAVTPDLASRILSDACRRIATPSRGSMAARIDRLIGSEAWTEAALALVELELPQWKLRRLVYEEGVWLCSLSKQWNLPAWLDDSTEARHESLPLAILSALIEALQCGEPASARATSSVPRCRLETISSGDSMCCDNFA
jgi:hypothetical protein